MLHGCAVMSCTIVHEQVFCLSILINTAIVCHGHLCKAYSCTIASWCVISFTMCWKLRISQPSFKATYQCYLAAYNRWLIIDNVSQSHITITPAHEQLYSSSGTNNPQASMLHPYDQSNG